MNRRGFLRIVEATIAIVIVLGVMFVFFTQARTQEGIDYSERARNILEEVSKNPVLRTAVLNNEVEEVKDFVDGKIPEQYLEHEVKICEVNDACGKSEYTEGDVYSAERIISATIDTLGPKKIRLFIWRLE